MNSKRIGNIGEAAALMKFVEIGIPVYLPFGDNEKADLIVELKGQLLKIQVKSSETYNGETTSFTTCSSRGSTRGKVVYQEGEIDFFIFYCVKTKNLYMVHFSECPDNGITIRHTPSKNNQINKLRWHEDYIFNNVINNLLL